MSGNDRSLPAAALAGGLLAFAALAGCEREPTVASKSAAAFREAQKRGEALGGGDGHAHGHGAHAPGAGHAAPDAAPDRGDPEAAHGHDHSAAGASPGRSAMGHGSEGGGHAGHAATGHGPGHAAPGGRRSEGPAGVRGAAGHDEHAGHGAPETPAAASRPSGAGHAGHQPAPGGVPPATPAPPAAVPAGQPAETLRPDALDAPAATSVLDAQRSAEMAEEMSGGGGHGAHGAGTYRQVDAGRGPVAYRGSEEQTPGAEPHRHGPAMPPSGQEGEHAHPPASGVGEEAAVYVCPMHPDVVNKTPGTCPKCGMALVERRER